MACFIPFPQEPLKTSIWPGIFDEFPWKSYEFPRVLFRGKTTRHATAPGLHLCGLPRGRLGLWPAIQVSAADPRAHGGGHGVAMRKFWLKGNFAGKSLDNGENDGENHGTNQGKMMGTLLKKWNFEEGNPRSNWRFFLWEIMEKSGRNQVSQQMSTVALCLKMSWGFN